MSLKKVKVMISGPVNGRLDLLHARVSKINSSKVGPFDLVLCTGRFSPKVRNSDDAVHNAQFQDFLTGAKKMPVPTFFIVQDASDGHFLRDSVAGEPVAENLHFLGGGGVKLLNGLKVGFVCDAKQQAARDAVLAAARKEAPEGLDVLLTNDWPEGIMNFTPAASTPLSNAQEVAMNIEVQDVAKRVNARYHFAASAGQFVQRVPFSAPPTSMGAVLFTRFVAVAAVSDSAAKADKWLHALSLVPAKELLAAGGEKNLSQLQALPKGCTANPFFPQPPPPKGDVSEAQDDGPIHEDGPIVKRPRLRPMPMAQQSGVWDAQRAAELDREADAGVQSFFFGDVRRGRGRGAGGLPAGYVCKICNVPGHHIRDCPQGSRRDDVAAKPIPDGYVCKICSVPGHWIQDCPQGKAEREARQAGGSASRPPRDPNAKCWFCLGSADVEKHLIASIGTGAYLAMPKGAINEGHVLIIPISHDVRTLAASPVPVLKEVAAYKSALRKFYGSTGRAAVFFERAISITKSQSHAFVEALPIPQAKADDIGALFIEMGSKVNIDFQVVADFDSVVEETDEGTTQYFCVELPDETCLVHRFSGFNPKSIQFGRAVLTKLLGCPERRDWKVCRVAQAEEESLTQTFKKGFEPFDPSEDDSDDSDSDSD